MLRIVVLNLTLLYGLINYSNRISDTKIFRKISDIVRILQKRF
jgi:hypothetical protein